MPLRFPALVNFYALLLDPLKASAYHPVGNGLKEVVRIVKRVHRPKNAQGEIIPGQSGDEETPMRPVQTSVSLCPSLKQPSGQGNALRMLPGGMSVVTHRDSDGVSFMAYALEGILERGGWLRERMVIIEVI